MTTNASEQGLTYTLCQRLRLVQANFTQNFNANIYRETDGQSIINSEKDGWMDDLRFYIIFNSISVISGR